jgi:antitoxin YefM
MIYWRYDGMKEAGMEAVYRLRTEELSEAFLLGLKETYRNKEIEIVIQEVEDETKYLLKDEANREHLMRAIAADKAGKRYRTLSMEELENMVS